MRWTFLAVLACTSACLASEAVRCDNGLHCPPGYTCNEPTGRCLSPEQLASCVNKLDGDECMVSGTPSTCRGGVCETPICGDGIRNLTEACDGYDLGIMTCQTFGFYEADGLRCDSSCQFDTTGCLGTCGDGIISGPEACEATVPAGDCTSVFGYYSPEGLVCTKACQWDDSACVGKCGDNTINGGELCDGSDPPKESCVELGLDASRPDCSNACGYDFSTCARFGFRAEHVPNATQLLAMHGSGSNDIWLVGFAGRAHHFDGTTWSDTDAGTLNLADVSSIAPNDAYAVTISGELVHWNGTAWAIVSGAPTTVSAVFALATLNVFVATRSNGVHRWNGSAWSPLGDLSDKELGAIHGSAPNDLWVATATGGELHHWTGSAWEPYTTAVADVKDILALASDQAYAIGDDQTKQGFLATWDGNAWTTEALGGQGYALSATATNDVWASAVGANGIAGMLHHFDGVSWLDIPVSEAMPLLFAAATGDVLATGGREILYRFRGQAYATNDEASVDTLQQAFWASESNHLFVAYPNPESVTEVAHFDGAQWTPASSSVTNTAAMWGVDENNVWIVGGGEISHFDGATWTKGPIGDTIDENIVKPKSLWAGSPTNIWVGGGGGAVSFYGTSWESRPIATFNDVVHLSGSGPDEQNVWAMSNLGEIFRWNGTGWTTIVAPTTDLLDVIVAIEPDRAIVMSSSSLRAYHWDGSAWTEHALPPSSRFLDIHAVSPTDVFALTAEFSSAPLLLHFDGTQWTPVRLPTMAPGVKPEQLHATARRIDVLHTGGKVRTLLRVQPWICATDETGACGDGVDNDCDGTLDAEDPECP